MDTRSYRTDVADDPAGRPVFTVNGSPVAAVLSRLRAGETTGDVASDFDLPGDQVTEVAFRAGLHAVA